MPFISTVRGVHGSQRIFGRKVGLGLGSLGGTITTAGGYRIHTFTSVGNSTFTPDSTGTVEVLVIGGGGYGSWNNGGGGGAGGYIEMSNYTVTSTSPISVTVGAGSTAPLNGNASVAAGSPGGDSIFGSLTAKGGGSGNSWTDRKSVV